MLKFFNIKGLDVLGSVNMEWGDHLQMIVGETGSGKSLLIKALQSLLGGRLPLSFSRSEAQVEGIFELPKDHSLWKEVDNLDSGLLRLGRSWGKGKKGKAWVQNQIVSLENLNQVASQVLEICGQFAAASKDDFIFMKPSFEDYAKIWNFCKKSWKDIEILFETEAEFAIPEDLLKDLKELNPSLQDYEKLEQHCRWGTRQEENLAWLKSVQEFLEENKKFSFLARKGRGAFPEIEKALMDLDCQNNFLSEEVEDSLRAMKNLENLEASQERLFFYQRIMRRCSFSHVHELLQLWEDIIQRQSSSQKRQQQAQLLGEELLFQMKHLKALGEKWDGESFKFLQELTPRLLKEMKELGLDFQIHWHKKPSTHYGFSAPHEKIKNWLPLPWDEMVSLWKKLSDQGLFNYFLEVKHREEQKWMPVGSVASGGELARLILSLRIVGSLEKSKKVLVFDEIDAGLSGKAAEQLGTKLWQLARTHQVLCVSHSPQVVAWGDGHHLVRKDKDQISFLPLSSREAIVEEIARLMSGQDVTHVSRENARYLLSRRG